MRRYHGAGGATAPEGRERTAVWPPVLGTERGATGGGEFVAVAGRGGAAVAVPPAVAGEAAGPCCEGLRAGAAAAAARAAAVWPCAGFGVAGAGVAARAATAA